MGAYRDARTRARALCAHALVHNHAHAHAVNIRRCRALRPRYKLQFANATSSASSAQQAQLRQRTQFLFVNTHSCILSTYITAFLSGPRAVPRSSPPRTLDCGGSNRCEIRTFKSRRTRSVHIVNQQHAMTCKGDARQGVYEPLLRAADHPITNPISVWHKSVCVHRRSWQEVRFLASEMRADEVHWTRFRSCRRGRMTL
eukprot:1371832-Pleurochrysis_carterae.AAC.1